LNLVEGLKPVHRAALLKEFGTADSIFQRSEMDLSSVPEIKPEFAYRIAHFDMHRAEAEVRRAVDLGFRIRSLHDPQYPALLKSIPDPPPVLYISGSLETEEPGVALVGSRKATAYGLNVTQFLAKDLSAAGITIVSGLARGIDARAHQAAIQTKGRTLAVLGSGLDVIYPAEHKVLARKIADHGAVISEFPLGTPPNRENFPIRNRIISGLSYAVVVVEASSKSGSLITARMASEQGRDVMAVPGSILSELSQGCNALIKDGAVIVRDWKDIILQLPEEISSRLLINKKVADVPEQDLTELEKSIIRLLTFDQPKHVDELAGEMETRAQDLLGALVSLELKNYITQMPGKHFIRVK